MTLSGLHDLNAISRPDSVIGYRLQNTVPQDRRIATRGGPKVHYRFRPLFQMVPWPISGGGLAQDESGTVAKYSTVVQYGYSLRQNAYRYAPLLVVAAGAALWSRASSLCEYDMIFDKLH